MLAAMTQTPPGKDSPTDPVVEPPASRIALVVWVGHDAAGGVEGIVERARTGEKERFRGFPALGDLIARMVGGHQ
jgi:hypothetical protein